MNFSRDTAPHHFPVRLLSPPDFSADLRRRDTGVMGSEEIKGDLRGQTDNMLVVNGVDIGIDGVGSLFRTQTRPSSAISPRQRRCLSMTAAASLPEVSPWATGRRGSTWSRPVGPDSRHRRP